MSIEDPLIGQAFVPVLEIDDPTIFQTAFFHDALHGEVSSMGIAADYRDAFFVGLFFEQSKKLGRDPFSSGFCCHGDPMEKTVDWRVAEPLPLVDCLIGGFSPKSKTCCS